jgi:hypothetical protein
LNFQDAVEKDFLIAAGDYHKTLDKDHSFIEIRESRVTEETEWFSMKNQRSNMLSMGTIKTQRITTQQWWKVTLLYIYSLGPQVQLNGGVI